MPFTVAHPILILPLLKIRKLSATGLIIGSIIPDVEFIIQMKEVENVGHHVSGIFLFDLPAAIICSYLFHYLIRDTSRRHMPDPMIERFMLKDHFDWHREFTKNFAPVILSFLIGILSHLIWDAFTHHDGYFVTLFPMLSMDVGWAGLQLPAYFALQIGFSIAGLYIVASILLDFNAWSLQKILVNPYRLYWMQLFACAFLIACLRFIVWYDENSPGDIMLGIMGSIFYAVIIVSLYYLYMQKKNQMKPIVNSFQIIDHTKKQFLVSVQKDFTGRETSNIRKTINSLNFNDHDSLYFDTTSVENIDLAGVNEIIQINEMLRSRDINFILAYKRNSEIEHWVKNTGMHLYLETAILP